MHKMLMLSTYIRLFKALSYKAHLLMEFEHTHVLADGILFCNFPCWVYI